MQKQRIIGGCSQRADDQSVDRQYPRDQALSPAAQVFLEPFERYL